VPSGDQTTIGIANTTATSSRLRMSRAIAAIDMPAWPPSPSPWAAAVRAAAASAPSPEGAIGSHTWPGTDLPAQW